MTGDGQSIWSMGEKYATFMKLSETHAKAIEKLNEEIARLSGALTEARKELDTLKASEQTQRAIGEKILRT
jgi:predicted ribosome quality control (RQC) complex YloA/Tae2 family protein